jgi:hypothetical protein
LGILRVVITVIFLVVICYIGANALLGECQPYGDVVFDGRPIEDGLQVRAFIGETVYSTSTTQGGGYSLTIPPDDPNTPGKEGWSDGDVITVQIDGRIATPGFEAFLGSERHDLQLATLGVKLDTWGKIKALFK